MNRHNIMSLTAALWLSCLAPGCAKLSESPNVGTNTNWLKTCVQQSDCGDNRSCLCGVCTQACASDTQCGAVHETTSCQTPTTSACGADVPASICLQGCRSSADCSALEQGVCKEGLCVPASAPSPDAGALPPPSSGFALSYGEFGALSIGEAYMACATHDDCALVRAGCTCCEQAAIDRELLSTYSDNREQTCADYRGPICNCLYEDLVPRCQAGRCSTVERATLECYSPTQNLDRATSGELVGCACSQPDAWICARAPTRGFVAFHCTAVEGTSHTAWLSAFDGPCMLTIDQTCEGGEIRASADACLSEFPTCYVLESGEYCGLP